MGSSRSRAYLNVSESSKSAVVMHHVCIELFTVKYGIKGGVEYEINNGNPQTVGVEKCELENIFYDLGSGTQKKEEISGCIDSLIGNTYSTIQGYDLAFKESGEKDSKLELTLSSKHSL